LRAFSPTLVDMPVTTVDAEWAKAEAAADQSVADSATVETAAPEEGTLTVGDHWFWHAPRSVRPVEILAVRAWDGVERGAMVRCLRIDGSADASVPVRMVPRRELSPTAGVSLPAAAVDHDLVDRPWPVLPATAAPSSNDSAASSEPAAEHSQCMPQQAPPVSVETAAAITNARIAAPPAEQLLAVFQRPNALVRRPRIDIRSLLRQPPAGTPAFISCLADQFGPSANNPTGGATVRADQGSWARRALAKLPPDAEGRPVTETRWSPAETQRQIEELVATNTRDMHRQLVCEQAGHAGKHRCRGGELRLLASDMLGAGQVVYDYRAYGDFVTKGETPPPLCVGQLDESVSVGSRWNVAAVMRSCERAGIKGFDDYGLQQITEMGLASHFDRALPRDLILTQNGSGMGRVPGRIATNLEKEEAAGIVSRAHKYLVFCPGATSRCSTVAKDGIPDRRIVFDYQQLRGEQDGGGRFGINAGIARYDEDLLRPLVLMAIKEFAVWLGVLQQAGPIFVAKTDFVGMYRQLYKPVFEWWFQLLWASAAGFRIDYCQAFGDTSGPTACHVAEDIFVACAWDEFQHMLSEIQDDTWPAPQYELLGFSRQDVLSALATMTTTMERRAAGLSARYPDKPAEWIAEQCRIAATGGFFDDTISGSLEPLLNLCVRAKLLVADRWKAEISLKKTFCGTADGHTGRLDADFYRQHSHVRWVGLDGGTSLDPGFMEGLGVEINLPESRLQISDSKHDSAERAIDTMVRKASFWTVHGRQRRVTPCSTMTAALGKSGFNAGYAPAIRGLLSYPYKCLRVGNTVSEKLNAAYRSDPRKFRGGEPVWAKLFFTEECEALMREAVEVSRARGGVAFIPLASEPGAGGRRTAWAMADAAGFREGGVSLDQQGGGGAWIAEVPSAGRPAPPGYVASTTWRYRKWETFELLKFSTWLEAANGTEVVGSLVQAGFEDIILVMDNEAWVSAGRLLSCRSAELTEQVIALARTLDAASHVRLFLVFHPREQGPEADAVSKAYIVRADGSSNLAWASAALQRRGFEALTDANRLQ
jgi:hypothetical protein